MSGELAKYEGNVSFGLIDQSTGIFQGYSQAIECNKFQPARKAGSSTFIRSKKRDKYNAILLEDVGPGDVSLTMDFLELPPSVLAILFAASGVPLSVTAGTFTGVAIPVGVLGTAYNIGHRNIKVTPAAVVKDGTNTTTYALGTDYTIDNRIGFITPLVGGTIVAGTTINVAGSFDVLTGTQYDGELNPTVYAQVFFDGKNLITGTDVSMEYYRVQIKAPDAIMDLLSSTPISATLTGTPLTPTSKPSAYRVVTGIA